MLQRIIGCLWFFYVLFVTFGWCKALLVDFGYAKHYVLSFGTATLYSLSLELQIISCCLLCSTLFRTFGDAKHYLMPLVLQTFLDFCSAKQYLLRLYYKKLLVTFGSAKTLIVAFSAADIYPLSLVLQKAKHFLLPLVL